MTNTKLHAAIFGETVSNILILREIGIRLCISKCTVIKNINKLQDSEQLQRLGSAKGSHWEVLG